MFKLGSLRTRALSVGIVQITGLITNLLFLFILPDRDLVIVIAAIALSGFISGTVVSNNTAKIYTEINAGYTMDSLASLCLRLLLCEQIASLIFCCIIIAFFFGGDNSLSLIETVLLGAVSSFGSVIAFVKYDDQIFCMFNYMRTVSTLVRLILVFFASRNGLPELIPALVIITFTFPFLFGIYFLFSVLKVRPRIVGGGFSLGSVTLREYLYGIPVALCRAFMNQGVLVAATEVLSGNDLRMFRFLMLPKDIISRVFNASLPLIFDRLYNWRMHPLTRIGLAGFAAIIAMGWYLIGKIIFDYDYQSLVSYTLYFSLYVVTYTVLPIMWSFVHANRAVLQLSIVLPATIIALMGLILGPTPTVNTILIILAVHTGLYAIGTFVFSLLIKGGQE